jgi:hypothetical protein
MMTARGPLGPGLGGRIDGGQMLPAAVPFDCQSSMSCAASDAASTTRPGPVRIHPGAAEGPPGSGVESARDGTAALAHLHREPVPDLVIVNLILLEVDRGDEKPPVAGRDPRRRGHGTIERRTGSHGTRTISGGAEPRSA